MGKRDDELTTIDEASLRIASGGAAARATHPTAAPHPGLGAHSIAHAIGSAAHAIGGVAHQVTQHAGSLIPPMHAAPHGAPNFHSGGVYRVSANGHAAPASHVPSGATVYVNGLHPFHNGTGDAIHGAQAIAHNQGGRDVYVVYNGHSSPLSVFSHGQHDPATARVAQVMQQNHGHNNFVGYSQGGREIVDAAQRYSAAGGTDGHHGLSGVHISAWGSTASGASVNAVAAHGAQVVDHVHPTVEHRVGPVAVPAQVGDFWARLGGGGHVEIVDGRTHASDAHTVAVAPSGDNQFHVYDGANPQLGNPRGK